MSLSWAMLKPSSSFGRPASGTSTFTTGAVRRAIKKPTSVIAAVSVMTPIAEMRIQDSWACEESARADAIKVTSRKRVRTSRYEKKPIVSHGSITAHGPRSSRILKPLGKSQKHTASTAPPTSCVTVSNGRSSRAPIYTCSSASRRTTGCGNFIGRKWGRGPEHARPAGVINYALLRRLAGSSQRVYVGHRADPIGTQRGIPWKNIATTHPYSATLNAWWPRSTGFSGRNPSIRKAASVSPRCRSNWTSAGTSCGSGGRCAKPAATRRRRMHGRPKSSRSTSAEPLRTRHERSLQVPRLRSGCRARRAALRRASAQSFWRWRDDAVVPSGVRGLQAGGAAASGPRGNARERARSGGPRARGAREPRAPAPPAGRRRRALAGRAGEVPQLPRAYRARKLAHPPRVLRRGALRAGRVRAPSLPQGLFRDRRRLGSGAPLQPGLERRRTRGIEARVHHPPGVASRRHLSSAADAFSPLQFVPVVRQSLVT